MSCRHELEIALRAVVAATDGVELDRDGAPPMITFTDPDNFQWEFFEEN